MAARNSESTETQTAASASGTRALTTSNTPTEEIQQIFAAHKRKQLELRRSTATQRIAKLKRLKRAIEDSTDELEAAVYQDFRKASVETELSETMVVISEIKTAIRELRDWMAPRRVGTPLTLIGTRSEVITEPKGTVLIIAPWNYPIQLAIAPLVASIAAGNTSIIKPSELTPHTSAYLRKLIEGVFTKDECAIVEGDASVSQALLKLPVDHIFFTGSTRIGKLVMEAASKTLASVTLELGGKSPVIVDDGSDLKLAAKRVMWGKVFNGGQSCVAPDYLLLPEGRLDEFVQHAKAALQKNYENGEDPIATPDFCRVITTDHHQRLAGLLHEAMESGAKVELGGASDAEQNYIAPTVISGVSPETRMMQEEIFGPLLPIMTYRKLEDAVDFINAREKPLALYVFSKNKKNIRYVLQNTSSGGAAVNDVLIHSANHNLPFGGTNHSGHGSYHGHYGYRELSHERGVLYQSRFFSALDMLYPPYTGLSKKLAKFTKKFLT